MAESPGWNVFKLEDGVVYHTYSRTAPDCFLLAPYYAQLLDQVPSGGDADGTDVAAYTREAPGMSAFALEDGVVYHTYSSYARGLDALWGMYPWLDRAPKGRNETGPWFRRHDEYDKD